MTNISVEENELQAIKSFLYLDEYKMYSISSQIFGGLTEYLIDYQGMTTEEEESQRGPLGSGRVIANILKSESRTQERKYLHDHSYSLFERGLRGNGKVLNLSPENIAESISEVSNFGFVAVKAKAEFYDMNVIRSNIANLNDLGEALAYVTNFKQIQDVQEQLDTAATATKDRNERTRRRTQQNMTTNVANIAQDMGLRQDPTLLKKLELLLEYGFQDQFEVQLIVGKYAFSAIMKREYLREPEHLIVRKYSRFSEKEFVLFGTISQSPATSSTVDDDHEEGDNAAPSSNIRAAILAMFRNISAVESAFSGKLDHEVVIDPIALYREI